MKAIESYKEFLTYFPTDVTEQSKHNIKRYFSLARRNRCEVFVNDNAIRVVKTYNNYELLAGSTLQSLLVNYFNNIYFHTLKCVDSGFEIKLNVDGSLGGYRHGVEYILSQSGEAKIGYFNNYMSIITCGLTNIIEIGKRIQYFYKHLESVSYKVSYELGGSYGCYLVIVDNPIIPKGTILDTYTLNNYSGWQMKRKPTEMLIESNSLYSVGFTIECNLSLETKEEVLNFNLPTERCNKQSFGCQKGCTISCWADSANKKGINTKDNILKLYDILNS